MKRMGFFSQHVYDENYDTSKIEECCMTVSDEQLQNNEFKKQFSLRKVNCLLCRDCPMVQKEIQ